MNTNKDNPLLFASENTIFRIVSIARILSWIILVFYLISFSGDLATIFQGQMNWPTQLSQWPIMIANLFFAPAIGLFYFLLLQGVAQGLNLGLDLYYNSQPDDEVQQEPE
jgi:Zn-dependent protease with chaperone function